MFSHNLAKNWNPYTVPATPNIPSGSSDVYSLSCEKGADSAKNPSQFLKWKKTTLPNGTNKGDILYWDPSAGDGGAWVVLSAPSNEGSILYWDGSIWKFLSPPSGSGLKVLTSNGGNLAWTDTEDC